MVEVHRTKDGGIDEGEYQCTQQTDGSVPAIAGQTVGIGIVLGAILMVTGLVPFHSAGFALAFTIGLVLHVPLAGVMHKG